MFYDDGGPNANYSNNKDLTMTFLPASQGGTIEASFMSFDTEANYDHLYIYDGTTSSASLIGEYNGGNNPGTVTATNADGALTFRFTSDYSVNKSGWAAHIRCLGVPMEVTASVENETIMVGQTNQLYASALGGSYQYTYLWSPADNLNDPTAQNPVFTATETGNFTYTVTVNDGSETATASVSFVVVEDDNVEEIASEKVNVYPNPASSVINIDGIGSFQNLDVTIVNIHGQIVREEVNSLEINVKDIDSGIYFVKINCDGQQYLKKIVIK